jgi:hypothetical protein
VVKFKFTSNVPIILKSINIYFRAFKLLFPSLSVFQASFGLEYFQTDFVICPLNIKCFMVMFISNTKNKSTSNIEYQIINRLMYNKSSPKISIDYLLK